MADVSDTISPEVANWIRVRAKEVTVRQADRSWAAEVVNHFREHLLVFLKDCHESPFFQSARFLHTGSYFEKVKIYSPDEFDLMLIVVKFPPIDVTRLDSGLFYHIKLKRPTRSPIKDFLRENDLTVSSTKFLSEAHRLVRKFIKTYRAQDNSCHWEVNRKSPSSPAVTLSLHRSEMNSEELISVDVVPALQVESWPSAARVGPEVDNWLGTKVRQEIRALPCYFVPKKLKERNLSEDAKESWRISFSHIEKKFITSHGNRKTCCESKDTKCCRKQSLMLLKSLIQGMKQCFPKELENLCSYHGKTTFFHTLSSRYNDSMWACQLLPSCFQLLVTTLRDQALQGSLPHFFVPKCNLFSPALFPKKKRLFLARILEDQLRDGFPLLNPPTPAPLPTETTEHSYGQLVAMIKPEYALVVIVAVVITALIPLFMA